MIPILYLLIYTLENEDAANNVDLYIIFLWAIYRNIYFPEYQFFVVKQIKIYTLKKFQHICKKYIFWLM